MSECNIKFVIAREKSGTPTMYLKRFTLAMDKCSFSVSRFIDKAGLFSQRHQCEEIVEFLGSDTYRAFPVRVDNRQELEGIADAYYVVRFGQEGNYEYFSAISSPNKPDTKNLNRARLFNTMEGAWNAANERFSFGGSYDVVPVVTTTNTEASTITMADFLANDVGWVISCIDRDDKERYYHELFPYLPPQFKTDIQKAIVFESLEKAYTAAEYIMENGFLKSYRVRRVERQYGKLRLSHHHWLVEKGDPLATEKVQ